MSDPVHLQILRNRIASIMREMDYRFYRSGYSTIVRESRDFSCVITDRNGRLAVAPPMFFHGPVYFHLIQRILDLYGKQGLEDGDTLVCNHPHEGNLPHVPDMALVTPVFHGGTLVAFAASIAHKADMGGAVAGSTWGQATDLFQEGLLLPPVKIMRAGDINDDLERLIAANSRAPDLVLGDMHAQIGITHIGRRQVSSLCERTGARNFLASLDALLDASCRTFRTALSRLPAGQHGAAGFLDSDGIDREKPVRLQVEITVGNDGPVHFDFSGSDPQTRGPANLRKAMVEACTFYCLVGFLDPALPYSDAARDLVRFTFASSSVLDPEPRAACSSYMKTCHKLVDVILQALDPFLPGRAIANAGGSGGSIVLTWHNTAPGHGNQYEILGSSYGAGSGSDGATGVSVHLANLHGTPIEIVESEFPCRIIRSDLVADSGGAGEFRGGLSLRRDYQMLAHGTVTYRADRANIAPQGLSGGHAGAPSQFVLHPGTRRQRQYPSSFRDSFPPGTCFSLRTAGGGGYGDPARRNPRSVQRDVEEGYVSPQAALDQYGHGLAAPVSARPA